MLRMQTEQNTRDYFWRSPGVACVLNTASSYLRLYRGIQLQPMACRWDGLDVRVAHPMVVFQMRIRLAQT